MISVNTAYPGTNPVDVDSLVSDKLYKEIKDIDGIKKITSTSRLGMSTVMVELRPEADTSSVIAEIRNNIGRAQLPADAKDPGVLELQTDEKRMFSVTLYSENSDRIPVAKLRSVGVGLKEALERLP